MEKNMTQYDYDVVVIGAGPGGYVAAIRASQLQNKVAIVEQGRLGGVCLNMGCIPSKALIHQAEIFRNRTKLQAMGVTIDDTGFNYGNVFRASRKAADMLSGGVAYLMKKNGIEVISAKATLSSQHEVTLDGSKKISAGSIILATGSRPRQISGFEFDEESVLSSDGALMLTEVPPRLLILGAGAIGCEFAHILNSFGSKVQMVEMMDRILPLEDKEITKVLQRSFSKRGIEIHPSTKALSMQKTASGVEVNLENENGEQRSVTVDKVLVVVGRSPNTDNIGLEQLGIQTENGFIITGDYGQTSINTIYAIGDIVASPLLAHVASREGEIAAEHIANHQTTARIDQMKIPGAVYCEPQVASFGLTEEAAVKNSIAFKKSSFPFRATGKAVAVGEVDGMVKILYDEKSHKILGAHAIGPQATELIHELLLVKNSGLTLEAIADMVHAHPTLSEAVMESAKLALGRAMHV